MRSPQNLTCMTKICSSLETSRKKVCYSEGELRSFPLQLHTLRQSLNDWSWRFSFTTRPTRLFGQVGVCSFLELASAHFSNCVKPCVLFSDNLSFSNLSRGINNFFFFLTVKNQIMSPHFKEKICHGSQTKNTICMQRELNYWKSTLASRVWYH